MSDLHLATSETSAAVGVATEEPELAPHLVRLPSTNEWALWRWAALRGAGFPAALVCKLSQTGCAAAADRIFQAEEEEGKARRITLEAVNAALDELRTTSEWDNKAKRVPLTKALRLLKGDKCPDGEKFTGQILAAVEALRMAGATISAANSDFSRAFEEGGSQTSRAIRELLESERLREAIIWQNRRAFHSGIDSLLRTDLTAQTTPQGFKQRQNEQLIASYVQRYTVKNDTIGFFGPVGWAKVHDSGSAIEVRPGAKLLSKRTVYFESWCIDQVAELFSRSGSFRKWAAPRLLAYYYVQGRTLYRSTEPPTRSTAAHASRTNAVAPSVHVTPSLATSRSMTSGSHRSWRTNFIPYRKGMHIPSRYPVW
jgi:hypothetical protein